MHYHLAPGAVGPGPEWWMRKTKRVLQRVEQRSLASRLLVVQYFPYHSRNFAHHFPRLPSFEFTREILDEAIQRQALFLCGRGVSAWKESVKQLNGYKHWVELKNPHECFDVSWKYGAF